MARKTRKQKILSDYRKKVIFSKIINIKKTTKTNKIDSNDIKNKKEYLSPSENKLIIKNYLKDDLKKSLIITVIILLIQLIVFYLLKINQKL